MNILLVYPEFPDTFWSFKHALEFVGKRSAFPPLGLVIVAALLPPEWRSRFYFPTTSDTAWKYSSNPTANRLL